MELDFTRQIHFWWALIPEMILCVAAMGVLIAGVSGKHQQEGVDNPGDPSFTGSADLGWMALGGLLLTGMANGWLYGVTEVGNTSMIAVDGFRLFANWIFLIAAALSILISFSYVHRQRLQAGEFYALILFATAGMMFMGSARDLIVIFLGLEVMSVAVYALTAFNRRDRKSAEAGLKYFLLGAFSTGFFLYGIALTYGATGSTNIAQIGSTVAAGSASPVLTVLGAAFLTIGFGFKVSAVPFHMWTPDVYEGAPAPVTAFMSAGVKAAAFVAFLRIFYVAFDAVSVQEALYPIMWWIAAITMVVANLIALVQSNVKRMLAYSSIAHAGYLMVAITAANQTAAAALLFYLLVYTVMNIGAFAIVIGVAHQAEERLQVEDYAGFGWAQPMLGVFLTIFLLSLAGFPGTGGFMAKFYLLQGAADSQLWYLSVILVLTTIASYWYYLRVAWFMWMKDPTSGRQHALVIAPFPMRMALMFSVGVVLYLGFFPGAALDFARASVEGLTLLGGAFPGAHTMNPKIFRQYDIRGIVGQDLDAGLAESVGRAFASQVIAETGVARPKIAVGHDNRTTSPDLAAGLIAGIRATGADVLDIGTVPTPTLYWSECIYETDAGVQITGSHNPPEWNGIKMTLGRASLYGDAIQGLYRRIVANDFATGEGEYERIDVLDAYVTDVAGRFELGRPMKVAVDCGNGSGALVAVQLLEAMGVEVTPLFCESDGTFPNHHPDPTVDANLADMIREVRATPHDMGVAFDGDADRIGAVDGSGAVVRGDLLLLLFGLDLLKKHGPGQKLVFDVKCSQALPEVFAAAGGEPIMWKTGHSLQKVKMKETGALLAGELSGHIMVADDYFGFDDALYDACRLISLVSHSGRSLAELVADFPVYVSTPEIRIEVSEEEKWEIVERAVAHYKERYDVIDVDGARVLFGDGWALLRTSNTQPVLVARFEARTQERLDEILNEVGAWLETQGVSLP